MINPLYQYISKHFEILKGVLLHRFKLNLVKKQFKKDQADYFLLELPESQCSTLKLNGMDMQVIEHHFTIPNVISTSLQSNYHYTVSLKALLTNQLYKVRLHFDKLGRLKVEPKLFAFADDEELSTHSDLDKEDAFKIKDLFVLSSDIILFIGDQLKKGIQTQVNIIRKGDIRLSELSKDLAKNRSEYIKECEIQIENIKTIENMGSFEFSQQRTYFEQLLSSPLFKSEHTSSERKELLVADLFEVERVEEEIEELVTNEKAVPDQIRAPKKKRKSEQLTRQNKKSIQKEVAVFIESTEKWDKLQGKLEPHTLPVLTIQAMLERVERCDGFFNQGVSVDQKGQLLSLKSAIAHKVTHFFNEENFTKEGALYLQAVHLGICHLDNRFIGFVISTDNVELVKKMLSKDLLEDCARYRISDDSQNFTIMEWCVHFSSIQCFKELMDHQFSLEYMDMENSPYYSLVEDIHKGELFLSARFKGRSEEKSRIYQRFVSILEIQCQNATEPQLTTLRNRIKIIHQSRENYGILDKYPQLKSVFKSNASKSFLAAVGKSKKFDFNKFKAALHHPEVQKALLEFLEVQKTYMLFIKNKHQFYGAFSLGGEEYTTEIVDGMTSFPLEYLIEQFKFTYTHFCKKMRVYMDIIESGLVVRFVNGIFEYRFNANLTQMKTHRKALEDLKAEEEKNAQTTTINLVKEKFREVIDQKNKDASNNIAPKQDSNTLTENATQTTSPINDLIDLLPASTSTPMFDTQALNIKLSTDLNNLLITNENEEAQLEGTNEKINGKKR